MACKQGDTHRQSAVDQDGERSGRTMGTEQILKNGCCGAVILWQSVVRNESLHRLHLAAQSTDTWLAFVLVARSISRHGCSRSPEYANLRGGQEYQRPDGSGGLVRLGIELYLFNLIAMGS
jgi:hypothetical protein